MTRAYNLGALYDAEAAGDASALIDVLDWENPRTYSYLEIEDAANAVARGLLKRGLARGDAVAILSANPQLEVEARRNTSPRSNLLSHLQQAQGCLVASSFWAVPF